MLKRKVSSAKFINSQIGFRNGFETQSHILFFTLDRPLFQALGVIKCMITLNYHRCYQLLTRIGNT